MANDSAPSITHRGTRGCKTYDLAFVSGSTGAVPTTFQRGRGVASVTRNSAGKYTIVVKRNGADVVGFNAWVEQASFALSGACQGIMVSQNVATAGGGIVVQFTTAPGVAVDPSSGDIVKVSFTIKYSAGLA